MLREQKPALSPRNLGFAPLSELSHRSEGSSRLFSFSNCDGRGQAAGQLIITLDDDRFVVLNSNPRRTPHSLAQRSRTTSP